jgi:hypothetical protein
MQDNTIDFDAAPQTHDRTFSSGTQTTTRKTAAVAAAAAAPGGPVVVGAGVVPMKGAGRHRWRRGAPGRGCNPKLGAKSTIAGDCHRFAAEPSVVTVKLLAFPKIYKELD